MYTPEQAASFDIIIKELKPNGSKDMGILSTDLSNRGVVLHTVLNIMQEENLIKTDPTPFNATVKLLKRGYEVDEAGGWIKYIEKENEKEQLLVVKESEQEKRAKISHDKTLLDIKKIQGDIERSDLQTEVLKKQDLKLASDIENVDKQTALLKAQITAIKRTNIVFWFTFPFAIIGGILATINLWEKMNKVLPIEHLSKQPTKTDTASHAVYQIQSADSAKVKK